MGSYTEWAGDIEDYTDEEVSSFNVGTLGRAHVDGLERQWQWLNERRTAGGLTAGERRALAYLCGGAGVPSALRRTAQDLFAVVTAPEDGQVVAELKVWIYEAPLVASDDLNMPVISYLKGCLTSVEKEMRYVSTMVRALPRYNKMVQKSLFPEGLWSSQVKKQCNRVLLRLDRERRDWEISISKIDHV